MKEKHANWKVGKTITRKVGDLEIERNTNWTVGKRSQIKAYWLKGRLEEVNGREGKRKEKNNVRNIKEKWMKEEED